MLGARQKGWGPSHQHASIVEPKRRWPWVLAAWMVLVGMFNSGGGILGGAWWVLGSLGWVAAMVIGGWVFWWASEHGYLQRTFRAIWRWLLRSPEWREEEALAHASPGDAVRQRMLRLGGGAYLGMRDHGSFVTADPEHAVLVLGPPRSGKTSQVVIPAVLAAPGPVLSTATKPDVMAATWRARSEIGQVWVYDPTGDQRELPAGVRRLHWSPISAAGSWDAALLTARAMATAGAAGKGTTNEDHWRERAAALLAPLLFAANLAGEPIGTVVSWVLRGELDRPGKILEDQKAQSACDVLIGIAKTEARERSSIFSATAGTLAAYNSDAARANAAATNFDPDAFPNSSDTVYVTAPAHKQALCAPLVVGLLEQIRYATYAQAAADPAMTAVGMPRRPPVFFCLDELANIAPIHDLPALISEAGGQGLHILACLQDLSQAKARWGESTGEGLLTLFQTKLILNGIADPRTLDAISVVLGEYDRQLASRTDGRTEEHRIFHPDTYSESVTHNTQRQRILSPGEIARLPEGRALLLEGVRWRLIRTTPWYRSAPWAEVAAQATAMRSAAPSPTSCRPGISSANPITR